MSAGKERKKRVEVPKAEKVCAQCGATFTPFRSDARYCEVCRKSIRVCARCGISFKSHCERFCPDCRAVAKAEGKSSRCLGFEERAQKAQRDAREARNAALAARDAEYERAFGSPCGAPRVRSEALRRIVEGRTVATVAWRGVKAVAV